MISVIDTSVLIDHTRGMREAREALQNAALSGELHSSEIVRTELLVLIRDAELKEIDPLLDVIVWHPVDRQVAELASALGRRWIPAFSGIGAADLIVAATTALLDAQLLTRNVKHFPMVEGLVAPY
ncbi:PIN domain-containing protein [Microbacterium sp. SD291]|uniref:PIN domain-containing protein n=1 Tax=Microbacterium sp. SD291 TaxID=2782007 RepID=UPI001A95A80D|nr:PIN domain-containing protein [Microbacterium sp. SD291]MBO0980170.1 PIN domain-containing protein [Microbacterium sp. SD291]